MLPAGAASVEGNIVATLAGYFCAHQDLQRHNRTAASCRKHRSAIIFTTFSTYLSATL